MTELIIEGLRVPLLKQKITLTAQANDISELEDRQTTFTNKFKAKKTPELIAHFANLGIVGNESRSPYEILTSKLIYKGVEVLEAGSAYLTGGSDEFYDFTIYDGNIFLFQELGNKQLQDLDFSDLAHSLSPANFIASFTNTTGYIYALSDNGRFDTTKIEVNYQLASVFISTIWKKIFEDTPFTYSGSIFTDEKFLNKVITPKRGYNADIDAIIYPIAISETINESFGYVVTIIPQQPEPIFRWQFDWTPIGVPNQNGINNGNFQIPEDGQYTYTFDLDFVVLPRGSKVNAKVWILGGGTLYERETIYDPGDLPPSHTEAIDITFSALVGDVIKTEIKISGESISVDPTDHITDVDGPLTFDSVSTSILDINISQFIGDMEQTAFVKDIMQHFGLSMTIEQGSKDYKFKPMQNILQDWSGAENWSDKYVGGKRKEGYQLKGYAQKNRMAYNYFLSESDKFADGFLEVDNKNLAVEKTLFTRPYNACDISKTLLNEKIITLTPFWEAVRDDDGTITAYKPIANKNYIAEVRRYEETITYEFTQNTGVIVTTEVPRLDFSNMNYQNLIEDYYERLRDVLDWNNVKELEFRLTAQEVKTLDFFKLKYIDKLSTYIYVSKVRYSGGPTALAEATEVRKKAQPCTIVANPGSYPPLGVAISDLTVDGRGSIGEITTYLWEDVIVPIGGSVTFDDPTAATTIAHFTGLSGSQVWTIQLTVANELCQSTTKTIIKTT